MFTKNGCVHREWVCPCAQAMGIQEVGVRKRTVHTVIADGVGVCTVVARA